MTIVFIVDGNDDAIKVNTVEYDNERDNYNVANISKSNEKGYGEKYR